VQIGITLVGIIAGAMGSGNIARSLTEVIDMDGIRVDKILATRRH
jgi:CBS domain containing-hemolysin-like protein